MGLFSFQFEDLAGHPPGRILTECRAVRHPAIHPSAGRRDWAAFRAPACCTRGWLSGEEHRASGAERAQHRSAKGSEALHYWCERGDSNPHGFPRQILSPAHLFFKSQGFIIFQQVTKSSREVLIGLNGRWVEPLGRVWAEVLATVAPP